MPNQKTNSHPYWRGLAKRIVSFVVMYNVVLFCLAMTVTTIVLVGLAVATLNPPYKTELRYEFGSGQNQLLSIAIDGMIVGSEASSGSFLDSFTETMTSGYEVKDKLIAAASDDMTHGVILQINSPGGTIYGSRAIADGVQYYKKKTNRPVYAYVQGSGLSGAYWAAISADKVFVDYGSEVGSIGVILGPFEYYNKVIAADGGLLNGGVITQNGIESTTIIAGKSKDIGNPNRRLTQEEIASLQKSANNEYDQFTSYVAKRRQITEPIIRDQIGAMSYDTKSAKELNLIDEIGSRDMAYEALAKAAGVENDFYVVREMPLPAPLEQLFSAKSSSKAPQVQTSLCNARKVLAYAGDVRAMCKAQ